MFCIHCLKNTKPISLSQRLDIKRTILLMYSAHVLLTIPVFTFFSTGLHVPQTLGEAMKVENAEANYEQTFENVYGMSV